MRIVCTLAAAAKAFFDYFSRGEAKEHVV